MCDEDQSCESVLVAGTVFLVKLDGDSCCSAHCTGLAMCEEDHESAFLWQAQYLVMLEGDSCCSARCTVRVMSDEDQSCESVLVAGAVFGEVGRWLLLLWALRWTFHV